MVHVTDLCNKFLTCNLNGKKTGDLELENIPSLLAKLVEGKAIPLLPGQPVELEREAGWNRSIANLETLKLSFNVLTLQRHMRSWPPLRSNVTTDD